MAHTYVGWREENSVQVALCLFVAGCWVWWLDYVAEEKKRGCAVQITGLRSSGSVFCGFKYV